MVRVLVMAAALVAAPAASLGKATGQKLARVLIGRAPPQGVPRFEVVDAKGADPLFVVIDTPYEIWSHMGSYVHVVAYTPTFAPAANAMVYVNRRPVGITDSNGTLVFRNTPRGEQDSDYKQVAVVLDQQGKRFVGWTEFESYARTESFESAQLFIYTDRGVYNPGQKILIRALAWRLRGDYEPLADETVEILLLDHRGRAVGGAGIKTDEFGIANLTLPLPEHAPEGSYTLAAQYKDGREHTELRVERFVPPAIEIKHTLKRYLARAQEVLTFSVTLSAFAGPPPKSGELQVKASYAERDYYTATRSITGAESYQFEIGAAKLAALKKAVPDGAVFRIEIRATDASGRSDTLRRDLRLATNPYVAVLEADKDEYVPGEVAKLQVKLIDLDGVPVRGKRVRLKIDPGDDPQAVKTNSSGIALFDVPMRKANTDVAVDAFVDDVEDPIASTSLYVMERKPMLSKVRVPVVRERRKVPIEVTIGSAFEPVEDVVHGDIVDSSGALVSAFLIPITKRGNIHVASGSLVSPAWGTMLLTLYCAAKRGEGEPSANNTGLLTEGQQITVEPNKALEITLSGVSARARPGQTLKVLARIKDASGRPVTSSLGVSLVDGAVLSLLDPLEITPADRYYNPELKVLSTTGSKILTWPVVTRNWGMEQMDIALPPFGFMRGGASPRARGRSAHGYGMGGGSAGASMKGAGKKSAEPSADSADDLMGAEMSRAASPAKPGTSRAGQSAAIGSKPAAPVITIRTDFPETSLWLDNLVASKGKASFEVTLPDAITRQTLTVVASDKGGGVGLHRQSIPVHQDLFARSDLPATLVLGDTVDVRAAVHNLGSKDVKATLTLESADLDIVGDASHELAVPVGTAVGAAFRVKPKRLGEITYEVNVRGGRVSDSERRTVYVRPPGAPTVAHHSGSAKQGRSFVAEVESDTALVYVSFPGAASLAEAFTSLRFEPWGFVEAPGARAVTSYYMIEFLSRQGLLTAERQRELRDAIAADLIWLTSIQAADGGFHYLRTGGFSPYLTGRALEGLAAAQRSNFLVPKDALAAAGRAILKSVDANGMVPVGDIAWWEGGTRERRLALTAELFRILCEAGPEAVPQDARESFGRMRDAMRSALNLTTDPLTLANLGLGFLAYHERYQDQAVDDTVAVRLVRRLVETRRRGHWEPSWFNAAGGTIEATAAAIELMWALDSVAAEPLIREATQYLLGARDLCGGWHNASGTAFTVRALAALPPLQEEERWATVTVAVNDKVVARARIDPKDPFASALSVARVDVTHQLAAGQKNRVEVAYTGTLEPRVSVETRTYEAKPKPVEGLVATRRLSATEVAVGDTVDVSLSLWAKLAGGVAIEEPLPANVTVDLESLVKMRERKEIADYRIGERLVIYLPALNGNKKISYRLVASRPGEATFGPTLLRPLARPEDTVALGQTTRLRVAN